jgi:hypothetical protein
MSQHLDMSYNRELALQLDAMMEETILYVREFFDQLKSGFNEYCQQVTETLILSEEFKQMYQRVLEDQKVLDDIDRDVINFPKHFVLKENFDRYVVQFEKTHDKYLNFTQNKLLPEVKLFKNEEFFKKLKAIMREDIHFSNNISEYKGSLHATTHTQGYPDGRSKEDLERGWPNYLARDSDSYDVNFLHYFQEGSKSFHIMNFDKNSLLWDTVALEIPFQIPLFSATIAARRDCILLAGGVDPAKGLSSGNVYVLNQPARTLLKTGELIEPRNNFSLARLNDRIYAIGGCNDRNGKLKTCESVHLDLNLDSDTCQP